MSNSIIALEQLKLKIQARIDEIIARQYGPDSVWEWYLQGLRTVLEMLEEEENS